MRSLLIVSVLMLNACGSSQSPEEGALNQAPVAEQSRTAPRSDNKAEAASPDASTGVVSSSSKSMSFDQCIATIQQVATELGVAPTNIVETTELRIVRFNTADGSVLVTCSAIDRKMVITRSPYQS